MANQTWGDPQLTDMRLKVAELPAPLGCVAEVDAVVDVAAGVRGASYSCVGGQGSRTVAYARVRVRVEEANLNGPEHVDVAPYTVEGRCSVAQM